MPSRLPRWWPQDYRRKNYQIAESLLNKSYLAKIFGQEANDLYWAGMNIQNLKESVEEVWKRGELRHVRNVRGNIFEIVEDLLKKSGP